MEIKTEEMSGEIAVDLFKAAKKYEIGSLESIMVNTLLRKDEQEFSVKDNFQLLTQLVMQLFKMGVNNFN